MKIRTFRSILFLCILFSGCAKKYADYSTSSGFDRTEINTGVAENLEVLGRVWGYVKYHHPAFSDDKYDLDCELFELLPQVADADPSDRNRILADWIDRFGKYNTAPEKYDAILADSALFEHRTDIWWIRDTARLGQELSDRLVRLRIADRKGNYYVTYTTHRYPGGEYQYENPCFDTEKPYKELTDPDYGYRLLAVFRFWNMVEYFFPTKYLTDKDWNEVLPEYIHRMVNPVDGDYRKEAWRMIAEINDNHAQMSYTEFFGEYRVPLNVGFIENKLLVISPDTVAISYERKSAFQVGAEIIAVDGKLVDHYIAQTREFVPCSHKNDVLAATADNILRSKKNGQFQIRYIRDGITRDTVLTGMERMNGTFERAYIYNHIDACKMLDDSIGYIYPAKYKYPNRKILDLHMNSKGLVIDMRCYPTREFAAFIGRYIIQDSIEPPFRMTYPIIELPGTFYARPSFWPTTSESHKYPYPIIVLVNSNTQSYAETCVQWMQSNSNVVVIGSQSAGANGNISNFTLPGNIFSRFSGLGWYYTDGWRVQRQGVKVDFEVLPTIEDIKAAHDEMLETAIRIINQE